MRKFWRISEALLLLGVTCLMILPTMFWSMVALYVFWKTEADREAIFSRGMPRFTARLKWLMQRFALREAKRIGLEAWLEKEERTKIQMPTLQIIPETASFQSDVEAYVRSRLGG